jgi:hypothetical protein
MDTAETMVAVAVAVAVVGLAAPARAAEASLLSAVEVHALEQRGWLQRDDARVLRILGPYAERVAGAERVRLADVRIARLEALECALGRVAARGLGVAQFFADSLFRGGATSLIVLVDRPTLAELDRVFDLHTIFPPNASGQGRTVHMSFLLAGQGKLVISYDGDLTYANPDRAYAILGNREYHLSPFLRMTIGIHAGVPALLDIAVADGPRAPLRPFEKDVLFLSPAIRGLDVHGRDVTADTSVINRRITPPPVDWRGGATYGQRWLQQNGCPADRAWTAP